MLCCASRITRWRCSTLSSVSVAVARGVTDQLVKAAVKANFWADSTIGLFGASFGAPLDENQESGLPAQSKKANAGGCFGGMGDTGIEPVTISL